MLLVIATIASVAMSSAPAAAHHCATSTDIFQSGGEASADCHLRQPDEDGSSQYSLTPEQQWNRYCHYQIDTGSEVDYADTATVNYSYQGNVSEERLAQLGYDPTGTYGSFIAFCNHPVPGESGVGGEFIYTIVPPVPVEDLRAIAKARILIDDPPVETNPSFTDRFTLVNIETWLWVDEAYWNEDNTESETAGFVTVSVWAEPESMTWSLDDPDGQTDTCFDPGTPWTPGAISTDCSVTFEQSSAGRGGDAFQGESTVTWIFSWSLNGADQGPFDAPFLATETFDLQVGEIPAVES